MTDHLDPSGPLDDELLGAFVDGELDSNAESHVYQRLATDPQAQQRVGNFVAANIALRATFTQGRATSTAIDRINQAHLGLQEAETGLKPASVSNQTARYWLSLAASLLIGAIAVLLWRPGEPQLETTIAATTNEVRALQGWYEDARREQRELSLDFETSDVDELRALLGRRWPADRRVPRLDDYGYQLVGARLHHHSADRATTNVVYQKPPDSLLIYAIRRQGPNDRTDNGTEPDETFSRSNVVGWTADGHVHAVAGSEDRAFLQRVSASILSQQSQTVGAR